MATEFKVKGTVEKVVRKFGSKDTQVLITIPQSESSKVPLGAVSISIETLQSAMFNNDVMKLNDKIGQKRKSNV